MRDHSTTSGIDRGHDIVLPAPDVWAVVPFAPAPETPPDDLVAYAIRQDDTWVLTDDVLAFAEVHTVQRFHEWRATWERVWTLDPAPNLLRLRALARELEVPGDELATVDGVGMVDVLSDDNVIELKPGGAEAVLDRILRVTDSVRERGAIGRGIVDRTPHSDRIGLVRSWPSFGHTEVVAATSGLAVVYDPETGLHLEQSGHSSPPTTFGPIDRADRSGSSWVVHSGDRDVTLVGDLGRPLAWLVPGASAWSVREVPEVVVWARTIAGMTEATEFARSISAPMRLTAQRPIADHGSARDVT